MARNIRLASIYVKIHNKKALTVDDLAFLAMFDPECFRKTCKNLIYNLPETKVLMEENGVEKNQLEKKQVDKSSDGNTSTDVELIRNTSPEKSMFVSETDLVQEKVDTLLDNLKKMEWKGNVIKDVNVEKVKNLLGNLYMEMLFPHDDKFKFFCLEDHIESSVFNRKV